MFKSFSKNLIFLDSEFTEFDVSRGEIISIGLVKMSGEELYLELEYESEPCGWVKKNVLPKLSGKKISKKLAAQKIKKFVGPGKPFVISYVNQFDMAFLNKIIKHEKTPFHWIPIDFASMLFSHGIDPAALASENKKKFLKKLRIDDKKFKSHNALDDAKLYRDVYLKLFSLKK